MESHSSALEGNAVDGSSVSQRKPDPLAIRQEERSGKCNGEEAEWKQGTLRYFLPSLSQSLTGRQVILRAARQGWGAE